MKKQRTVLSQMRMSLMSFALLLSLAVNTSYCLGKVVKPKGEKVLTEEAYKKYVEFFEKVYDTIEQNYYRPVDRADYDRFLEIFRNKIYTQLINKGHSIDYIRWRSAAKLVEFLKDKEDIFSAFYPPEPAKEYEQSALDKRIDLGIQGKLIDKGFEVSFIEPRSDAFVKGLRKNDLILEISGKATASIKQEEIDALLNPMENSSTPISYLSWKDRNPRQIEVLSMEYVKQSVFEIPIPIEGYCGLEIKHFNRMTGNDVLRFMEYFKKKGEIKGLVLDLRNNPGGPPLAARELVSFFLTGGDDFAFFQKKNQPKALLDVPPIPEELKYYGQMVILINKKSGSSSELFSGVMQRKEKAVLMGRNSAGQVMLKSMFNFEDKSMVLLITSRGHFPDGAVFSFDGLKPDRYVPEEEDSQLVRHAVNYMIYVNSKNKNEAE
ncbi:MAG: hypothetical protein HQL27_09375 [Candidatus Omnitrophica bacterium]|nr:hypothetical protein [Candidatus Omnitrophota bacterium]